MCPGDLANASVLAAIARPPYYYEINALHSSIFLLRTSNPNIKLLRILTLRFHNGLTHNLDKMSYALQNMYRHVPDHILNARIARPIAVDYTTVFLIWPKFRT